MLLPACRLCMLRATDGGITKGTLVFFFFFFEKTGTLVLGPGKTGSSTCAVAHDVYQHPSGNRAKRLAGFSPTSAENGTKDMLINQRDHADGYCRACSARLAAGGRAGSTDR